MAATELIRSHDICHLHDVRGGVSGTQPYYRPGLRHVCGRSYSLLQQQAAPQVIIIDPFDPCRYWIDTENLLVYLFPPEPPTGVDGPPIALMYQPRGVLNISRDARNVTLSDMAVVNGRHAGILARVAWWGCTSTGSPFTPTAHTGSC